MVLVKGGERMNRYFNSWEEMTYCFGANCWKIPFGGEINENSS